MSEASAAAVMQRFGKAFFARDRALLAEILTDDAEWHFAIGTDAPDGRVRKGIDGFLQGIDENERLFSRLRFDDVVCRWAGDQHIVMTYLLDGERRGGDAFALRGIELITMRDGRIARKDVFWKQYGDGGG